MLFQSVYQYIRDMLSFFEELEEGFYVGHNLDVPTCI